MALALGVRSTLFSYFADLDLTPAQAATRIPALIALAGPFFCLAFGIVSWVAFRVVLGTTAVVLVNQPMPGAFVSARIAEGSFWLFAAAGALVTRRDSPASLGTLDLRWADAAAALFVVIVVRLMVRGIPLSP